MYTEYRTSMVRGRPMSPPRAAKGALGATGGPAVGQTMAAAATHWLIAPNLRRSRNAVCFQNACVATQ